MSLNDELVAAEPAHGDGGTHTLGQAQRDRLQQPVADGVAQRLVDVLESIQVEKEQCQRRAQP